MCFIVFKMEITIAYLFLSLLGWKTQRTLWTCGCMAEVIRKQAFYGLFWCLKMRLAMNWRDVGSRKCSLATAVHSALRENEESIREAYKQLKSVKI